MTSNLLNISIEWDRSDLMINNKVFADEFTGADDAQKIQAAIDFAQANHVSVVELSDRDYIMTQGIIIKGGVKLQFSYGSRFVVYGNYTVIELQRNASLSGGYIAIDDVEFRSNVIFLNGKNNFYNVWGKTLIENTTIVNWSESHKGTAIFLYSNGDNHNVSYVNFDKINIVGMHTGIKLQAKQPSSGFSYVNANRFLNFSMDDCLYYVTILGSETIPYECTGNTFTNMQIQPNNLTKRILLVNGQYNDFDGLIWDLGSVSTTNLISLTNNSSVNSLNLRGIPINRIVDNGTNNQINLLYV